MTDIQKEITQLSPHPKRKPVTNAQVVELKNKIAILEERCSECEKRIDSLTKKRGKSNE